MATVADVARQVLDLSKATFDNVFLTFDALQGALERTVLAAADQAAWVPGELKTVAHECVDLARRTRRDVKRTGDRCHQEFHALVDRVLDDPPAAMCRAAPVATDAARWRDGGGSLRGCDPSLSHRWRRLSAIGIGRWALGVG